MKNVVCAVVLLTIVGCHRVVIHVDSEDEHIRLSVPYSLVESAIHYNAEELVIDDLSGVDAQVNLRQLIQAIRDSEGAARIDITEGSQTMAVFMQGNAIRLEMDDPDSEEQVRLFLPIEVLDRIDLDSETQSASDLAKAFRKYRGPLIELDSPYERIRIELR